MSISLRDLAPLTGTVPVRGQDLTVHGITVKRITALLNRFSELRKVFVERQSDLTGAEVASFAPPLLAAIIAEGLVLVGAPDREKELKRVEVEVEEELVAGEQIDLVMKIFEITFPRGVGPFVAVLREAGILTAAEGASAPARPSAATGRAQGTNSQSPSTES